MGEGGMEDMLKKSAWLRAAVAREWWSLLLRGERFL
jgi:hypothetical protein